VKIISKNRVVKIGISIQLHFMKLPEPAELATALQLNGYAILPNCISKEECLSLVKEYESHAIYRGVIDMERYRFGKGQYKYFSYPLPEFIQRIREQVYPMLVGVANKWMVQLGLEKQYPALHSDLIELCRLKNQLRPTPLILKYEMDGYNTLHQDLYGEIFFPFQMVIALSQSGEDFTGGEFILIEQVPRAQSKAEVIHLNQGDGLLFTTNFKPVKSCKGYYKANIKHGISRVRSGKRFALGIIFHDAS
jgi:uncharacterized protein